VHRLLGLAGVVFLFGLLVTGLALQHADDLGLDNTFAANPTLISWWGIEPPTAYTAHRDDASLVVLLGDLLFVSGQPLVEGLGSLVGAVDTGELILAAASTTLVVSTPDGALVDRLAAPATIYRVGRLGSRAVIDTSKGMLTADTSLMNWSPATGGGAVQWNQPVRLDAEVIEDLQRRFLARTLSWERVTADLHSGRALGRYGPLFVDLVAITVIILGITGLLLSRRPKLPKP
jgi:uncharacterized iron-regulated membrane protein